MLRNRWISFELTALLYFISYVPNVIVTRIVTTTPNATLGHPPTGLQTLPSALLMNLVLTYLFIWLSGWHRDAHGRMLGSVRVPVPTRYTLLSAVGTALVLFTVPLSFTFRDVSIPFMQLLMRGDILIIAPIVDLVFGRRVRWWSWVALVLVGASILLVLRDRGDMRLPPLALATVLLYILGYFIRLAVMTRVSKSGNTAGVRAYFVEEKLVALPLAVLMLALLSWLGTGNQASELGWGFIGVWTDRAIWPLAFIAVTLTAISIFAAIILLDPRENSYCVPVERTASLLAGLIGAWVLSRFWGQPAPAPIEWLGALVLIPVILLLWFAPRFAPRRPG